MYDCILLVVEVLGVVCGIVAIVWLLEKWAAAIAVQTKEKNKQLREQWEQEAREVRVTSAINYVSRTSNKSRVKPVSEQSDAFFDSIPDISYPDPVSHHSHSYDYSSSSSDTSSSYSSDSSSSSD